MPTPDKTKIPPPPPAKKMISEEDVNKLKSSLDKQITDLTKRLEAAEEAVLTKESELAELRAAGDDPDAVEKLRRQHVELTKNFNAVNKELKGIKAEKETWETERAKSELTSKRNELAKKYEVDEDKVTGETEAEMVIAAQEAKIAKLQGDPKVPGKNQHEIGKIVGAGETEPPKKKGWQIFADATREAKEAGEK